MKKFFTIAAVAVLAAVTLFAAGGNGVPNDLDKLYSLQIIAYDQDNCPQGNFTDTSRRQIAVAADVGVDHPDRQLLSQLVRDNDILLAPGDFKVIDGNACQDGLHPSNCLILRPREAQAFRIRHLRMPFGFVWLESRVPELT
jgi:hypothetical protein